MYYLDKILIFWNIFIFILYGIDKSRAKKRRYRISELTLILPTFVFSAVGAMLGMIVFNHKTSKTKFRILIPLAFLVNLICYSFLYKNRWLFGTVR